MSKSRVEPLTSHYLNDILADSSNYSKHQNKLFKNLAIPMGFYVEPVKITGIPRHNNNYENCLDEKVYSKLLSLVEDKVHKKSTSRKGSVPKKKGSRNTKKHRK